MRGNPVRLILGFAAAGVACWYIGPLFPPHKLAETGTACFLIGFISIVFFMLVPLPGRRKK